MAAAASCCPAGALPSLTQPADHVDRGHDELLGDLPVYVTRGGVAAPDAPPAAAAVVVFPDIFGNHGGRVRGICDELAAAGPYLVVMPDLFRGAPWPAGTPVDFAWVASKGAPAPLLHDLTAHVLPYLHARGYAKIGAVGFCFGGYVSFLAATLDGSVPGAPAFACGVGAHSSVAIFDRVGSSMAEGAANVRCPQQLLQAGNDPADTKAGGAIARVFAGKPFGAACVFKEYPDMAHGWVPRGDLANPAVARDVALALADIKAFLHTHLLA